MKLLNKTFKSIEEVADFVKNNKDVREKWRLHNWVATADKKFQIEVFEEACDCEDSFDIHNWRSGNVGDLYVNNVRYLIRAFDIEMNLGRANLNKYAISNAIVEMFDSVLVPGDMFVYDKPCDGMGSYDIYAIANVNGIIMAEFIRNSTKSRGSDEHEVGTKGLETLAMMEAWKKYIKGEGTMKYVHEYVDAPVDLVI